VCDTGQYDWNAQYSDGGLLIVCAYLGTAMHLPNTGTYNDAIDIR